MLFTWSTKNLCIIFPGWHVRGTASLLVSLLAVIILTAGYEAVREASRRYEISSAEYMNSLPSEFSLSLRDSGFLAVSWRVGRDEEYRS